MIVITTYVTIMAATWITKSQTWHNMIMCFSPQNAPPKIIMCFGPKGQERCISLHPSKHPADMCASFWNKPIMSSIQSWIRMCLLRAPYTCLVMQYQYSLKFIEKASHGQNHANNTEWILFAWLRTSARDKGKVHTYVLFTVTTHHWQHGNTFHRHKCWFKPNPHLYGLVHVSLQPWPSGHFDKTEWCKQPSPPARV